ncbi:hypothetical protein F4823DRAFT_626801 [Ustulina deusta]|nr:hypothetical protein F4823DRAFT_626801 [Ustulina deusta]
MDALSPSKTAGWKKGAKVNCTILVVVSLIMIGLSSIALTNGFQTALFFYSGNCSGGNITTINLGLHLLINVVSTLVVLNSPSREEIDKFHSKGSWLDVGVSSIHNTFRLSKFKSSSWSVLVLSSVPIHLLFNSAVFRTDYRASLLFPAISPPNSTSIDFDDDDYCLEYGLPVSASEYSDKSSAILRNISTIAIEAGQRTKLNSDDCKRAYTPCQALIEYGNVIMVVNKPGGWIRDDMWKLQNDESRLWDQYIPPKQPNHLFFDTACQPSALDISVDYCLVQPLDTICQVGVSPALLLIVTICVVTKTFTVILVTTFLSHTTQAPLVTPGDAIASFITKPDAVTIGYCTMSHRDIREIFESNSSPPLKARPWHGSRKPWASAIPRSNWTTSYLFITIGVGICVGLFGMAASTVISQQSSITRGGFFPSNASPTIPIHLTFINSVLLANSPQLLLTFCYFTYNNIFTHLHSAREWAQFGYGFFPLRVTNPKGHQLSTYRLQLPYQYSLSLVKVNLDLGYYEPDLNARDPSLLTDSVVLVGYSPPALLTLMIAAIILALIPPIWSMCKRLPPNIVIPGCNSLALSAACHVSRLSHTVEKADNPDDTRLTAPVAFSLQHFGKQSSIDDAELEKSDESHFEKVAQSKLSWGVIHMPPEWYTQNGYDPASVGHLGFGTVEDGVAAPLWEHLYA